MAGYVDSRESRFPRAKVRSKPAMNRPHMAAHKARNVMTMPNPNPQVMGPDIESVPQDMKEGGGY